MGRGRGGRRAFQAARSSDRAAASNAFLIFAGVSTLYFGAAVASAPRSSYIGIGPGGDPEVHMWFLTWWPWALLHGYNPFVTDFVWAPTGINLTSTASVPGTSLLLAPLTLGLGPTVSYNLAMVLAPALAAWGAYLVCHRVTGAFWPSIVGGYVFGFSSYMLGHMLGHLSQVLIFPAAISVYLVLVQIRNPRATRTFVMLFAGFVALQFSFATEGALTMTVFGAVAMIIAVVVLPEARTRLLETTWLIGKAYVVAGVLVSPYLYYLLRLGPLEVTHRLDRFSSDLLNFVIPTPITAAGGDALSSVAQSFRTDYVESGAYIGPPLLLVTAHLAVRRWSEPLTRFLVYVLGAVCIASLGPALEVAGLELIPMPWLPFGELPFLASALPSRFTAYGFLALGVIAALWLSDARIGRTLRVAAGTLIVVSLLPNVLDPYWKQGPFWRAEIATPPFFEDGLYKQFLKPRETIVVFPYANNGTMMLSQARSQMYFRLAGGYLGSRIPPEFQRWPALNTLLTGTPSAPLPVFEAQFREFVCAHDVSAVVVDPPGIQPWEAFAAAVGPERADVGGVTLRRVAAPVRRSC